MASVARSPSVRFQPGPGHTSRLSSCYLSWPQFHISGSSSQLNGISVTENLYFQKRWEKNQSDTTIKVDPFIAFDIRQEAEERVQSRDHSPERSSLGWRSHHRWKNSWETLLKVMIRYSDSEIKNVSKSILIVSVTKKVSRDQSPSPWTKTRSEAGREVRWTPASTRTRCSGRSARTLKARPRWGGTGDRAASVQAESRGRPRPGRLGSSAPTSCPFSTRSGDQWLNLRTSIRSNILTLQLRHLDFPEETMIHRAPQFYSHQLVKSRAQSQRGSIRSGQWSEGNPGSDMWVLDQFAIISCLQCIVHLS